MKKRILSVVVSAVLLTACGEQTAEEYSQRAQESFVEQNYKAAIIDYQNSIKQDPKMDSARVELASVYVAIRKFDAALDELSKVSLDEKDSQALHDKFELIKARALHKGESGYLVEQIDAKGRPEILFYQIMELAKAGKLDAAKDKMSFITLTSSPFYILSDALISAYDGNGQIALGKLNDLVPVTNEEYSSYYLLSSDIKLSLGELNEAAIDLESYLVRNPKDDTQSLRFAQVLVQADQLDKANGVLQPLVKKYPHHALINELVAVVAYEAGDYKKSKAAAMRSIVGEPNKITTRLISAYSSDHLGQSEDALAQLEVVIDRLPESHPANRLYLKLQADHGDLEGMAKTVLKMSELKPQDVPLLSDIGLELVRRGDVEQAKQVATVASSLGAQGESNSSLGLLQLSLDDQAAFDTLEGAFSTAPDSRLAGSSLATAYLAAGKYDKAIEFADEWIKAGNLYEGYMLLGVANGREGDSQTSLSMFEQALNAKPDSDDAKSAVVEALVRTGNVTNARNMVTKWASAGAKPQVLKSFISAMHQVNPDNGAKDSARFAHEIVKKYFSDDASALLLSAQSYYFAKMHDKAQPVLESVKSTFSQSTNYWLLYTSNSVQLNKYESALAGYLSWIDADSVNPMPLTGAVKIYAQIGEYKKGIALIEEHIEKYEDKGPGDLLRVQLLISDGQFDEARRSFTSLPSSIKRTQLANGLLGILDFHNGNPKLTVERLTPLYQAAPYKDYLRWLVKAHQELGQVDKAKELLTAYVDNVPEDAEVLFILANMHAANDNYKSADEWFTKALALGIENPLLFNNAAFVSMQLGDLERALKLSQKAVDMAPQHQSFIDTLASVLIELGREGEAIDVMRPIVDSGEKLSDSFKETYAKAQSVQ